MIKYNRKEKTFIIIDRNRTMIYDSRVGFLNLKALSLKDNLESDEIYKLIAYMKPLMDNATDRKDINTDNFQFYFNKLLTSQVIRIQNDILTNETVKAKDMKSVSAISGIMGTFFMIYNYMNPDTTVKTAGLVAADASNILKRTNSIFSHAYGDDDKDEEVGDQRSCFADKQSPSSTDQQSPRYTEMYKLDRKDKPGQG